MKNEIEQNNKIEIEKNLTNEKEQKSFLETTLGKTINSGIDIGIRALLPDFIEEKIVDIKNNLLNYGIKDGITKTIDDAIDLGKSAIGMVTGKFDNVIQMQNAVKSGGIIDNVSSLLDTAVNGAKKAGLIDNKVANTLKKGKNIILNNVEKNIENTFEKQSQAIEYTNKYIDNWKDYFNNKDFSGMEKEYKKIQKNLKELVPIEKTINDTKNIEILHNLIKNNGQNFNLSKQELELVEKLK